MSFRRKFVEAVYADHNASPAVRSALSTLLEQAPADAFILNIGAGFTRFDSRVRSLEIEPGPGVDYVGSATQLPIENQTVDLVITQEVLEHVDDPFQAMKEIHRVLKPDGIAYVQLPFIIGYHPCPDDYWRFTQTGIEQLARQAGFRSASSRISVGSATGAYRVAVEFFAILFTFPFPSLYHIAKAASALVLYPLKWMDRLLAKHPEAGRIAGGFFIEVRK